MGFHGLARLRGKQPRDYLPDFATLNAQSTRRGARPGPKLAPWCTRGPPACLAAESARKDPRAPDESVQMSPKKNTDDVSYTFQSGVKIEFPVIPHQSLFYRSEPTSFPLSLLSLHASLAWKTLRFTLVLVDVPPPRHSTLVRGISRFAELAGSIVLRGVCDVSQNRRVRVWHRTPVKRCTPQTDDLCGGSRVTCMICLLGWICTSTDPAQRITSAG